MRNRCRHLAVLFVMLPLATPALAQIASGALTGQVLDPQGLALPGAGVTVTGPQGAKSFVTDQEGEFRAPFLIPGSYTVRAKLEGFKVFEQSNVIVVPNQTYALTMTLEIGGLAEVLHVAAYSPVIDVTSTTVDGMLDSETLTRLPVGRNFTDTLYLVPGVSDSSGVGRANPSIGGASGLDNSYTVDGVSITDPGFGGVGSYSSTFGSLGSGVTIDFIKETHVKAAGFEAEYGNSTGGVVTVVTKSGGNLLRGAGFGYFRPGSLEAGWKEYQAPNGTVNTVGRTEYDVGASVGGPIVQDRLWYHGTFNPQSQNVSYVAPEGFPTHELGEVIRKRKLYTYAGKISAQLGSSHRGDVSIFGDPSKGEMGPQRFSALRRLAAPSVPATSATEGGYSELTYGGHNQTVRYDGVVTTSWLVEAWFAHATNNFQETPKVDEWAVTDTTRVPRSTSGGLGGYELRYGRNLQLGAKSTQILKAGGTHQVRYGFQYEDIGFTRDFQYSGPSITIADGRTTLGGAPIEIRNVPAGNQLYFRATRGKLAPAKGTTQKAYALFLQDTWQMDRLTIRPGIRWDRETLIGFEPTEEVRLCFEGDTAIGAADGTGPAMPCTYTWNNWSPRIGATYDLTGTGRMKVYASWGRFYAKVPNNVAVRALSADPLITRQDYYDAGLTRPIPNGVAWGGTTVHTRYAGLRSARIDPRSGSTYKQEFMGGVEFEVLSQASVGIRYVHRTLPQILEDIGQLPMVGYFLPGYLDTSVEYFITNVNAGTPTVTCCGLPLTAFENPAHTYDSLEFTFNKRFQDNWAVIGSYRYSRLKGNFEGFFRSDNGQFDMAITSLFDFPTNDPTYTEIGAPAFGFLGDIRYQGATLGAGRLPNDRPHQVKVFGSYVWNRINVGAGINVGSGKGLTALAANPTYGIPGEIPMTLRGEGFDTSDGFKTRSPMETQVDLHVDYDIGLGGDAHLLLLADVFNLFNRQAPTDYNGFYESSGGVLNPNFGLPEVGGATTYQAPLALRIGARLQF